MYSTKRSVHNLRQQYLYKHNYIVDKDKRDQIIMYIMLYTERQGVEFTWYITRWSNVLFKYSLTTQYYIADLLRN